MVTPAAGGRGEAHRDQRKPRAPPHPACHVIVRRMPLTDAERRVCKEIEARGDDLGVARDDADRVRHDGAHVGDPPRDEAALQEYLA